MSKTITQLIDISPEELRREIRNDIRLELQELAKSLTPKEPTTWITRQEAADLIGVSLVTIHTDPSPILWTVSIGYLVYFS